MSPVTSKFIICVYYDPDGKLRQFMEFLLLSLKQIGSAVLLVVNGDFDEESKQKVTGLGVQLILRENYGYDFQAYKEGYRYFKESCYYGVDELVFCNSSCYGPIFPLHYVFSEMSKLPVDFWGITQWRGRPWPTHIQSYFMVFKKSIYLSDNFDQYWKSLPIIQSRDDAIRKCEVLLTQYFANQGYKWATFIRPTSPEFSMTHVLLGLSEGLPFVKRKFFSSHNVSDSDKKAVLAFIQGRTKYNLALVYEDYFYTNYRSFEVLGDFLKSYIKRNFPRFCSFLTKTKHLLTSHIDIN